MPYLGIIITSPKVPHLTSTFQARLLWYLMLSVTIQLQHWLGQEKSGRVEMFIGRKMGNQYLQRIKLPSSWVKHMNM